MSNSWTIWGPVCLDKAWKSPFSSRDAWPWSDTFKHKNVYVGEYPNQRWHNPILESIPFNPYKSLFSCNERPAIQASKGLQQRNPGGNGCSYRLLLTVSYSFLMFLDYFSCDQSSQTNQNQTGWPWFNHPSPLATLLWLDIDTQLMAVAPRKATRCLQSIAATAGDSVEANTSMPRRRSDRIPMPTCAGSRSQQSKQLCVQCWSTLWRHLRYRYPPKTVACGRAWKGETGETSYTISWPQTFIMSYHETS